MTHSLSVQGGVTHLSIMVKTEKGRWAIAALYFCSWTTDLHDPRKVGSGFTAAENAELRTDDRPMVMAVLAAMCNDTNEEFISSVYQWIINTSSWGLFT